jgi:hypothetical protein
LQEFDTAVEQLAHRTYPALPEDHIRREAGKAFAEGVEDPAIKIQLLLGIEKTMNEDLGQGLELQTSPRTFWWSRSTPTGRGWVGDKSCLVTVDRT